jgi:hypothetical protein
MNPCPRAFPAIFICGAKKVVKVFVLIGENERIPDLNIAGFHQNQDETFSPLWREDPTRRRAALGTLVNSEFLGLGCGRAQILAAWAGRATTRFYAEFTRFQGELAVFVKEGHHLWSEGERQSAGFSRLQGHLLEANQFVEGNDCRSL